MAVILTIEGHNTSASDDGEDIIVGGQGQEEGERDKPQAKGEVCQDLIPGVREKERVTLSS